jgi:arabinofuranosyltransferase
MNTTNFESKLPNQLGNLVMFLGISVFLTLLVRTAWQADDAYTAWRLVDNFVHGFGLRNNIDERVQTFTSTLWTMLNAGVFFFTRNIYYTSVALSILCSLLAVWVAALPYRKATAQLFFLFGAVTLSISFMDFSVGGFENPLGHLILATFAYFYFFKFGDEITPRRFTLLFFIAGLAALNRLDTPAFYLPLLLLLFFNYKAPLGKKIGYVLLGLSPLILWHLFALIYFGFPLQNAAYAKRFNGIPTHEFLRAGVDYYVNSFSRDPITLLTAVGALIVSLRSRDLKLRYLGYGIAIYMMYVLYIGGDYMSGRFFSMIFFASVLVILRSRVLENFEFARVALPAVVLLGCLGVNPTFTTRKDYGAAPDHGITSEWLDKGIADERASWYQNSGVLFASRHIDMPKPAAWWDFNQAVKSVMASVGTGPCVLHTVPAGYFSYYMPRECHMYDLNGQVDPLMARIPNRYNKNWRQGHLFKDEIPGYQQTLVSGKNEIKDPDIALYYDKIRLITRGDIWSWERFKTIADMNLGRYDYLLKAYADRNGISW